MFPCTKCGCCCRKVDLVVKAIGSVDPDNELYFPYKWDNTGRCENLTKENLCAVYDNRPLLCNIDRFMDRFAVVGKDEFYAANIESCNALMDQENIPIEFRIPDGTI